MGCTRPIRIRNKKFNKSGKIWRRGEREEYLIVPCGQCINCRTKRRNELETMLNLEMKNYKGVAVFGTLTYTDEYLMQKGRSVIDQVQNIPFTANHNDFTKFMKRLRINLERKGYKQKLKYVYCTEYGDIGRRCHMHFIIFGLTGNMRGEIQRAWRDYYVINGVRKKYPIGIVQADDIKAGGLRYVIKYMDYAPIGTEQKRIWSEQGLEPPMIKHSGGLGQTEVIKQIDRYKETGKIKTGKGAEEKTLSRYYRLKYGAPKVIELRTYEDRIEMKNIGWKHRDYKGDIPLEDIMYRREQQNKITEADRLQKLKQQGIDITIYDERGGY